MDFLRLDQVYTYQHDFLTP